MNFTEREVLSYLREEYDSRLRYFLREIEVRDSNDNDLISSAEGLKVKDSAGYVYTVGGVMNDDEGRVVVRLIAPEEARGSYKPQKSSSFMFEKEVSGDDSRVRGKKSEDREDSEESEEVSGISNGIISRNKSAAFKRSFDIDADSEPVWKSSGVSKDEEGSAYIDIPIEDFEKRFTL